MDIDSMDKYLDLLEMKAYHTFHGYRVRCRKWMEFLDSSLCELNRKWRCVITGKGLC